MRSPGTDVVELLRDLVRIPSVNPLSGEDASVSGEAACARAVAAHLHELGASEVTLPEVLPGRPNVLAHFASDGPPKPRLLFAPHLDTVSVSGMSIDPFGAELRDGKVHGRGSTDTKGTMAAMLRAFWNVRELLPRLSHEVWFAGLADEEAENRGAQWLVDQRFAADFAIVGEPTGCDLVHRHKGALWLQLRTQGRAAHAATPERGENAIYTLAAAALAVRDRLIPELSREVDDLLGSATASLGLIRGGRKVNVVPDWAEAELDVRTLPTQQGPQFAERVIGLLRDAVPGLEVRVLRSQPPLHTERTHPLIGKLEALGSRCIGVPWFCDGSVLASAGIPAIAAGPGDIAQAHTADEFLAVDDLRRGEEFYTRFLRSLAA
ncbi:MAG: M20 family metallopeptidase [Verrucomicrobia bacterium]|nr:M20 family metallopeptidase [Verrucomicrobiota bacterium]